MTIAPPAPPQRTGTSPTAEALTARYALLSTPPTPGRLQLRLLQAVPSALQALRANKIRSILTALGIIIGVAAVIAVVALGQGASASVSGQLQGLGTNVLTISPGSARTGGVQAGAGTRPSLTVADTQRIQAQVPDISALSPVVSGNAQMIAGNQNWQTRIQGVEPPYQELENWSIADGSLLTEQDEDSERNVVVIGQTVNQNLFPTGNAVGSLIRVRNVPFTVVGVLAAKGATVGGDQDDTALVPFSTAQVRLFGTTPVSSIVLQVDDASAIDTVTNNIDEVLREQHKLRPTQQDDFTIRNNNDLIQRAEGVSNTLTLLLASVAIVSLVVGGIGIMNIMLVSVTERTREIGIRTAIGAQPRDILMQFLLEALVLSLLGGSVGILLGVGVAFILPLTAGWATSVPLTAVALAFGFSALVGIFFGIYPARKASRLDPIEALRYQ